MCLLDVASKFSECRSREADRRPTCGSGPVVKQIKSKKDSKLMCCIQLRDSAQARAWPQGICAHCNSKFNGAEKPIHAVQRHYIAESVTAVQIGRKEVSYTSFIARFGWHKFLLLREEPWWVWREEKLGRRRLGETHR